MSCADSRSDRVATALSNSLMPDVYLGRPAGGPFGRSVALLTVIERGLAWCLQQEVGPPDRKLWVRHAR